MYLRIPTFRAATYGIARSPVKDGKVTVTRIRKDGTESAQAFTFDFNPGLAVAVGNNPNAMTPTPIRAHALRTPRRPDVSGPIRGRQITSVCVDDLRA